MKESEFGYKGHRNSYTELNEVYFWTITINKWQHLVKPDDNRMIVTGSLQWLVQNRLVKIMVMWQCPIISTLCGSKCA